MKKKLLIIIIAIVLIIAVAVALAISLKGGNDTTKNEKELILPEAKNDKIETKLPDDSDEAKGDLKEKANASYDEFMEIYGQYENETDETKKREQLDKIQAILDSVSK